MVRSIGSDAWTVAAFPSWKNGPMENIYLMIQPPEECLMCKKSSKDNSVLIQPEYYSYDD